MKTPLTFALKPLVSIFKNYVKSTCLNFTKFFNFTEKAGYTGKIKIGMDVAASEFHKDGKYDLDFKNPESKPEDWISSEQLCEMYKGFVQKYPVVCTCFIL